MHDDTVLPVHNKCTIPSRSYIRIQFVQEKTRNSLFYLKWPELIACLLCLSFACITIYSTDITKLSSALLITSNSVSVGLIVAEISFPYFKKDLPLILQIVNAGFNAITYGLLTFSIYQTNNHHDLVNILQILHGATSILFLIDFLCKLIISKHLYQTTQAKSVADVGTSTNLPYYPSNNPPRKPARSALTTTPITYGGTFPVRKNQPPFMPNTTITDETLANRHRPSQNDSPVFDFGPSSIERLMSKSKKVQTYLGQEEKGAVPPFYLDEERKKKTPWTSSRRRQASRSTPITYSGTFACNKELVPIAPSSPNAFPLQTSAKVLDQISEELSAKMSAGNCSLTAFFPVLPGCTMDDTI